MTPEKSVLKKYAQLIVQTGLNLKKEQTLVITSPVECAYFAREVVEAAYLAGARDVVMNWKDELFSRLRFLHAEEQVFAEFPDWQKDFYTFYLQKGAAFLSISASDPEIFKGLDVGKLSLAQKTGNTALKGYREKIMNNENAWCVISIPTPAWAKKVFPDLPEKEAMRKLWDAILKTVRVDREDPVASWTQHKNKLKKWTEFLNGAQFAKLKLQNSQGTDLSVELPDGHIWLAGSEYTKEGREFTANMPTEEVFTMPKKTGANGTVSSSKPLNYNGNLIKDFSLTLKDGKIIEYTAKEGQEVLKQLLETDPGAAYLGEVALVPYDSPISNSNILFYNTLFDENASCHLAVGKAYKVCLRDADKMSEAELEKAGVNDSLVHVDFMIGTSDLKIIGITKSGEEKVVFEKGNFAI